MCQAIRSTIPVFRFGFCLLWFNESLSQLNPADILGTVSDPGGAVITGVKITVVNASTNDTKTATTSSTGDYIFNLMPPGTYTITAEASGFKKSSIPLSVSPGDRGRAHAKLEAGNLTEVAEVGAQSPALQPPPSTLSTGAAAQSARGVPSHRRT